MRIQKRDRCLLCLSPNVIVKVLNEQITIAACNACHALVKVDLGAKNRANFTNAVAVLMPPVHEPTFH